MKLVLASTSPYRRDLLGRLGLPFDVQAPGVDETHLPGETPAALVSRLSEAKARAVRELRPDDLVIGSDQVAAAPLESGPLILGKPGDRTAAIEQLRQLSGRRVDFLTGLCVIGPAGSAQLETEITQVRFRYLAEREITAYLDREKPYGCAASFRSERLGITLVESMHGHDPNALLGLPLIRLCGMLRRAGLDPLE